MSLTDIQHALTAPNEMAAYLEIRDDIEIIADINALVAASGVPDRDVIALASLDIAQKTANGVGADAIAQRAYEIADAMIKQSNKK